MPLITGRHSSQTTKARPRCDRPADKLPRRKRIGRRHRRRRDNNRQGCPLNQVNRVRAVKLRRRVPHHRPTQASPSLARTAPQNRAECKPLVSSIQRMARLKSNGNNRSNAADDLRPSENSETPYKRQSI